jgi:hypothetical protein
MSGYAMFDKFDHKFKNKRGFNFFVIFVGLFFAAFLMLPENWQSLVPLAAVTIASFFIAYFSSKNLERRKNENK